MQQRDLRRKMQTMEGEMRLANNKLELSDSAKLASARQVGLLNIDRNTNMFNDKNDH